MPKITAHGRLLALSRAAARLCRLSYVWWIQGLDEERGTQEMSAAQGSTDPAVHRRRLRTELRNARETAGMTQRDVAKAMDWSQSKLIRIESGVVNISTNDLRALLSYYDVDSSRTEVLVELARAARETTRWSIYKDVASTEFIAFLGYESSASIVRNFEPFFVPGLLQTEEYARTVISIIEVGNPHKVDPLVDLRMERQELLVRNPPADLHFIMDEAVIRRVTGGRDVMRRQLRHLQKVIDENPNVTVRIIPFRQGNYHRQHVAYWLFEFPDPADEYVLYLENPLGEYITRETSAEEEDKESPASYLETFFELEQVVSREVTLNLLRDAISQLMDELPPATSGSEASGGSSPQT
jgi:transcriptional regulator with XRE-family HTH domain